MKTIKVFLCLSFLTINAKAQWKKIEHISSSYIYDLHFDNNNIYAAGDSLYISTDKGINWDSKFVTNDIFNINSVTYFSNKIFAGTNNKGVYVSNDLGETWTLFNNGLGAFAYYAKLFFTAGDTLFYGTDGGGIYYLIKDSETWQSFNQNLPSNYAWTVNAFTVSGNNYILSSGASGFYYLREKGSAGWTEKTILTPQGFPRTPSSLFASGDTVFAGTNAGIYRSGDNGVTWDSVGITALPLTAVSFVKDRGRIYAAFTRDLGNDFYIWYSDDMGDTWHSFDHQFQYLFKIFVHDNKLWAATSEGLLYTEFSPSDIPSEEIRKSFSLEQNYPNPFNPITNIDYELKKKAFVILKVYNITGTETATLINEEKPPGKYQLTFDATGLASGIYFYKMAAGSRISVKKMILLK